MKVCYFTATGNSMYVAKRMGGELISIPHAMKNGELEIADDVVGIVCPVYAGQMPGMVRAFMNKAVIKADYVFFLYTYGMSSSVAEQTAMSVAAKAGIKLDYVNKVLMVDNYLPGFEAQKQINTVGEKDIEGQLDRICSDIDGHKRNVRRLSVLDKAGMAVVHGTMGKAILKGNAAHKYIVNDSCIKCGICAKVCPADNITVTDKVIFSDHCEVCYACIHNCPKNAIHLKSERSMVRFRNEHITVKDIIESNE